MDKQELRIISIFNLSQHLKNRFNRHNAFLEELLHAWRSIFDSMGDPICLLDLEGRIQRCNQSMSRFLGKPFHQIVGRSVYELIYGSRQPTDICPLGRVKSSGQRETADLLIANRWYKVTVDPYLDNTGKLAGAVHVIIDITEQKQIENELREYHGRQEQLKPDHTFEPEAGNHKLSKSLDLYRQIVENANEGICIFDENLLIVFVNHKMRDMLDYTIWNVLEHPITGFVDEEWRETADEYFLRCQQGAADQCELKFRRQDGTSLWAIVSTSPLVERGHYAGTLAMVTDITCRKWAEDALRVSEGRFSKAFTASPFPMAIHKTTDWRCTDVNDSFLRFFGYCREEVIGRTFSELNAWINPPDQQQLMQKFAAQGRLSNMEVRMRDKHGPERTCLLSVEPVELGGRHFVLSVVNDLTELKQLEKEVMRLDRLNLIGEMAAGIGHEIRNPITTVRGFLQMLGDKKEYTAINNYFNLMIDELDRANSIITELISLAKDKALDLKIHNLNTVVKNLCPLIQADAQTYNCRVDIELGSIPDLLLDEKEIRQILLNLTHNGLEAMNPGGTLTVSTFTRGPEVVLAVRDKGPGIDPLLLEKIGTPFFTTKDQGTGLGLAVCYSIAARHQASIKVETSPQGTSFLVLFPSSRD